MKNEIAASAPIKAVLAALLLTLPACSDSAGPGPQVASLSITGVPTVTLLVGDSVRLVASASTRDGAPVTTAQVSWSTTAASVATVSETGLVRALAPGTAKIVARTAAVADTVDVNVQALSSVSG